MLYVASTFTGASAIALRGSPMVVIAYAFSAVRPSFRCAAICALVRVAFSPSSQTIGSASSAFFARHHVSATTATVVIADAHRALHARHLRDGVVVEARQLAAVHRARLDRRAQHAGQLEVDRVDEAAVELGRGVEPLHRLAGDLPRARILERDALRIGRRHLGGGRRDLAVARGASRRRVRDDAALDRQLRHRHLPPVGRRLQQHDARHGAAAANVVLGDADAAAAAGAELAPYALAPRLSPGVGNS